MAPGTPHISKIPGIILVGTSFNIAGTGFTHGSRINFFVATSRGGVNMGPLTPTAQTTTLLTVRVPDTVSLGQGFVTVEVVNTDTGFKQSNLAYALLQGFPPAGIPTIKTINGADLAATSSDPTFATNNVEVVVPQGTTVKLGGTAFDVVNGVGVDLFCACPPNGKLPTMFLNHGDLRLTSTQIMYPLPAQRMPNSPPTGPGAFVVSNKGADGQYSKKSNAVSVPIGEKISVLSVTQAGGTITVNGTGFSTLTVINFFNTQGAKVVNLGGLGPGAKPLIPLTVASPSKFSFARPAGAVAGASYVQALNPPFVPFTSSGNGIGGAFILKAVATATPKFTPKPTPSAPKFTPTPTPKHTPTAKPTSTPTHTAKPTPTATKIPTSTPTPSMPAPLADGSAYATLGPIVGATVTAYKVGTTGYGQGAAALAAATTDTKGNFSFTSDSCNKGDLIYYVSRGGDAGAGINPAIALMSEVGVCGSLPGFVLINEVTTVATVNALAQFTGQSSPYAVGTSATNIIGIKNAFAAVGNLVDVTTGTARSVIPSGGTAPQSNLNTLANALVSCAYSGPGSARCAELFACAKPGAKFVTSCSGGTGATPVDTLGATLNIALNPASVSVTGLYHAANILPIFTPALTSVPGSLILALNFSFTATDSNLLRGVAIDAAGNVWVTHAHNGQSPLGAPRLARRGD